MLQGVPHPPGYPLQTIISMAGMKLPLQDISPAQISNFISAVFGAGAATCIGASVMQFKEGDHASM